MTTADYLESLQTDLSTIVNTLDLNEGTNFTDIATMTTQGEITKGGGSSGGFTGHYDATGLGTIGWTSDDIAYYQNNAVLWNSDRDNDYKLNSNELAGNEGTYSRFIKKTSNLNYFQNYYSLIGLPSLNISRTSWDSMFRYCYNLITIPTFNTSNATSMVRVFAECRSLISIPLLDTSNVTTMNNMFNNCYSLRSIPQLNTGKVTNMGNMFNGCHVLSYIPELDTSKVTNFQTTFGACYNLSDSALYNILEMCRKASSYAGTKTLTTLGIDTTLYSQRIQALDNYSSFTSAGWSIS